jgi:ethanolamine utilization protein EutP (predicted NTPase)
MKEVNYLREMGNEKVFEISAVELSDIGTILAVFIDHQMVIFMNFCINWSY